MLFVCYWMDVAEAARMLSGDQGAYLRLMDRQVAELEP